jgi:hypothetical protein
VAEAERTFAHALGTFGAGGRADADEARPACSACGRQQRPSAASDTAAAPHRRTQTSLTAMSLLSGTLRELAGFTEALRSAVRA